MKSVIPILLCLSLSGAILTLSACVIAPPHSYVESRSEEETDRDLRQYRRGRRGECHRDRLCGEACDKIFTVSLEREKCEELPIEEVERLEEVFRILEDPDKDGLEAMDLPALQTLLDIGLNPLRSAVSRMSLLEREIFLTWLAGDPSVVEIIERKETDFEILKEVFGNSQALIVRDLNRGIEGGKAFAKIALYSENEPALEWLHTFFGHICDKRPDYRRCMFEDFYCALSLSRSAQEDYFNYEFFEDLLNDILANERKSSGAPDWWTESADSGDMDSWKTSPHNVCAFLK